MDTTSADLSHRQFMWGLSNGIFVLTTSGAYWFSAAAWFAGWPWFLPIAAVAVVLGYGAWRVRMRSGGFRRRDLVHASDEVRTRARRIVIGFRWVSALMAIVIWMAIAICHVTGRDDLIWPSIALAVSLHFAPIGYFVRVRPYYLLAACGSIVATAGLVMSPALLSPTMRLMGVGAGMGMALWTTAVYVLLRAERLVRVWDDAPEPSR